MKNLYIRSKEETFQLRLNLEVVETEVGYIYMWFIIIIVSTTFLPVLDLKCLLQCLRDCT